MPPKKATTGAATKKATSSHASYRDMIKDAIMNLKERNGSSRQSIKKYVQMNNQITVASQAAFDSQFNKAIKAGVEKGEFSQPKGPSGPVKLAKKEVTKPAAKKPAAKPATKKTTTTTAAKKTEKPAAAKPAAKKATATKKTTTKPKANTAKPRKTSSAAPAVVDQPKVETKTKSGRVTKTAAKPAPKKAAPKKKAATPKKTETA